MSVSIDKRRSYDQKYMLKHYEIFKESQKRYRSSEHGKRRRRSWYLKKFHNMTIEQYDEMLIKQGHRCAICGIHQSELKKVFDIDHCHSTGKIRGILCNACNQALGLLDDSQEYLEKALEYLRRGSQ